MQVLEIACKSIFLVKWHFGTFNPVWHLMEHLMYFELMNNSNVCWLGTVTRIAPRTFPGTGIT